MPAAVSTITQSGQVSLGERVQIVAVPKDPLTLGTREEFWESVARADEDYAAGRVTEIRSATDAARTRYGL